MPQRRWFVSDFFCADFLRSRDFLARGDGGFHNLVTKLAEHFGIVQNFDIISGDFFTRRINNADGKYH